MTCIEKEIVGSRNMYITQGVIDKSREPFSIRYFALGYSYTDVMLLGLFAGRRSFGM